MKEEYINSFIEAIFTVLPTFGLNDIKISDVELKENMYANMEVTSVIGLMGSVRGNISYSFSMETARKIASSMMMGMPVTEIDEDARSAIAELSNLITGKGCKILSSNESYTDFTTPTFIIGNDILFLINTVKTLTINVEMPIGEMQVNIGLEL